MKHPKLFFRLLFLLVFFSNRSMAQEDTGDRIFVSGYVTLTLGSNYSLDNIMVDAASGKTTFTNKTGYFQLVVPKDDTLYFYIGSRRSNPYCVRDIKDPSNWRVPLDDIMNAWKDFSHDSAGDLGVIVTARDYHRDSLNNRNDYGKYFDYKKPTVGQTALGMLGSPVTALYEGLNKKKQRRMTIMRNTLEFNEQEGYIDNRFNLKTVSRYVRNQPELVLLDFMQKYRPKYADLKTMGEIELALYITQSFKAYEVKYLTKSTSK